MKYVTKKDIVIPAGTVLYEGPKQTTYYSAHGQVDIELGPDMCMTLTVPIEHGIEAFDGLVMELKE